MADKTPATIFLAGATGAIGTALIPLLLRAGYTVFGGTRRQERAAALEAAGVRPVVADVFDAPALAGALAAIRPTVVVHQLTDLPPGLDLALMAEALPRNARVRDEGTRNLVAAAYAAGCGYMVAQSIAWAYAPGPLPQVEDDPLDLKADGIRGISVRGVAALEDTVLHTPGLRGAVLRYGYLYGPGTGATVPAGGGSVHVEAAAWAALLAVQQAAEGLFNVAEDSPQISSARARRELGWDPALRLAA
jgi:nucleoside-diphosphate-sugar epimerase